MKKFLGIFLAAVICMMMAVAVNAADVYVNDGGEGDGTSAEAPLGSMTAAIEAIAAEGGTVHIVDTYTCPDQFVEPAHAGDIVITGGKYIFTNGSFNRWYLSGEGSTTFENITFEYATLLNFGQFYGQITNFFTTDLGKQNITTLYASLKTATEAEIEAITTKLADFKAGLK